MLTNSNKQQLTAYLQSLQSDLTSSSSNTQKPSTYKQKYQAKILQLLICLQQSTQAYDELNKNNMSVQREMAGLRRELGDKEKIIDGLVEEKEELGFEVKGQITEIMRLEEEGLNMNHTLEELRKRQEDNETKNRILVEQIQKKCQQQIAEHMTKIQGLELEITRCKEENKRLEGLRQQDLNEAKQQIQRKQIQCKNRIENIKNQAQRTQNKIIGDYETKINSLNTQLQTLKQSLTQQKYNTSKTITTLQSKTKVSDKKLTQLQQQKTHLESLYEQLQKQSKQKQKQLKSLKKSTTEQSQKIAELGEECEKLRADLLASEQKRKQVQRKEVELQKQLEQINEEYRSDSQVVNRQKEQIRECKDEIRKIKEEIQGKDRQIKELESSLYKNGVALQDEKKKHQQTLVRLQFIQKSNIKLNQKLALQQQNRQKVLKTIVSQKDLLDKQNLKLLQLLQIKQNMIRAIVEGAGDIEEPKLIELEGNVKTRESWAKVMKEDLRDSEKRRSVIDRWLLN